MLIYIAAAVLIFWMGALIYFWFRPRCSQDRSAVGHWFAALAIAAIAAGLSSIGL